MFVGRLLLLTLLFWQVHARKKMFLEYIQEKTYGKVSLDGPDKAGVSLGVSQVLLLIKHVTENYLLKCSLVVIYHSSFAFESKEANFDLRTLFQFIPIPFAHAWVTRSNKAPRCVLEPPDNNCRGYIVFVKEVEAVPKILGNQTISKVVVVTSSSRWKIHEFLTSTPAKGIVNLLVIATTGVGDVVIRKGEISRPEKFLNMYTHELYTDGLGGSTSKLITSWKDNKLSKDLNLFPPKMKKGFNGRQFAVIASEQVPFTIKKAMTLKNEEDNTQLWDGIEVRLLKLLAPFLNFTIEVKEASPTSNIKGSSEVVIESVMKGLAEIGIGGVYKTTENLHNVAFSAAHSVDCAAFVTRTSTALPRYRAILGPFQWTVWLTLTIIYLIAILPLTYADQHSLRYLWDNPWHFETMFWYVFGTFTNLFSFKGEQSWTKSDKNATRLLIGWYWAFSIIVTACYTGSIIAFVTLFVYPPVINNIKQLIQDNYRIGSLSTGGWGKWFNESEHPETRWLLRDIELVPNVTQGLKNVTKSFYLPLMRPYAFLGSRAQLDFIITTNYTLKSKKDLLYVTKDCFVPFGVSLIYPSRSPYIHKFDEYILRVQQSGLLNKIVKDIEWEMQRSSTGVRLQVGGGGVLHEVISTDRQLTLDDTQGMFLLLGAGFLMAIAAFISETLRHRKEKLTFRFWMWQPKELIATNLWTIVRSNLSNISNLLSETIPDEAPSPYIFPFKTFDSRLLNSQYGGVSPHNFTTKRFLIKENGCIERTTSMPRLGLQMMEMDTLKLSSSCHQINAADDLTEYEEHKDRQIDSMVKRSNSAGAGLKWNRGKDSEVVSI